MQDEAEQKARVEVGGQVAGFLGLGDRLDLSAGEGDAGRVGLALGAGLAVTGNTTVAVYGGRGGAFSFALRGVTVVA